MQVNVPEVRVEGTHWKIGDIMDYGDTSYVISQMVLEQTSDEKHCILRFYDADGNQRGTNRLVLDKS